MSKIFDAIRNSHYSKLSFYMKNNYDFKVKSQDGSNVFMVALEIDDLRKRYKMLEFLLKQDIGVDLAESNMLDRDVFFLAVIKKCEQEINYLLKGFFGEIDWYKRDKEGKTILHHAVISNNSSILENLLNYCSKYRINVDIPDGISKITPFLLANRLNNYKAVDLLVNIGQASKSQIDALEFNDAERWKQQGQLEAFQKYLKAKEAEMNYAKLNGNIRLYKELNQMSKRLDNEVSKNPDLLPMISKMIIEGNEKSEYEMKNKKNSGDYFELTQTKTAPVFFSSSVSSSNQHKSLPLGFKTPRFSRVKALVKNLNENNSKKSINAFQNEFLISSSHSNSSSSPLSSASSRFNAFKPSSINTSTAATTERTSNLDSNLNTTMNKLKDLTQILEMTNNAKLITTDYISSSKLDSTSMSSEVAYSRRSSDFNQQQNETSQSSFELTDLFYEAALQNTDNFRVAAKPLPLIEKKTRNSKSKPRLKTGLSTLAIIREESLQHLPHTKLTNANKKNSVKLNNSSHLSNQKLIKINHMKVKV